ncbi:MAG: hypothetical protein JWP74_302 [Marmoricola sp.]|nr:hypothetical protein [Marmoricola sp.]
MPEYTEPENDGAVEPAESTETEATAVAPLAASGAAPMPPAGAVSAPILVPRLRDRAWSLRSLLAVGLASLLIGGAGGATIVAATHDDHSPRFLRVGGPGGFERGRGVHRFGGQYGGQPGNGYGGAPGLTQQGTPGGTTGNGPGTNPGGGVPVPPKSSSGSSSGAAG